MFSNDILNIPYKEESKFCTRIQVGPGKTDSTISFNWDKSKLFKFPSRMWENRSKESRKLVNEELQILSLKSPDELSNSFFLVSSERS